MEKETKPFTQEQIDKIVARATELYADGSDDDVEVDPITVEEQETALSQPDVPEGGVWVRAWVYVRLSEVFGGEDETEPPECGHSACRQNWIETANPDCVKGRA